MPVNFTDDDPVAWLADPIDPMTGELLSIDRGFYPIDSDVITSVRTVRASGSAVEDVGQQFANYPRVDLGLPEFHRQETVLALQHLISAGDIELQVVAPSSSGDTGFLDIQYKAVGQNDARPLQAATGLAAAGN